MGMAYQGPENGNRTKRYISRHAMDRLRQRSKAVVHLREYDLMFMIDDVVERAIKEGCSEEIIDTEGEESTLVEITSTLDQSLVAGVVFALIKPDYKEGRRDAIVTIIDEKMAQRLRRKEIDYKQVIEEPLNQPFQVLADMKVQPKEIKSDVEFDQRDPVFVEPQVNYLVLGPGGSVVICERKEALQLLERSPGSRLFKECRLKIKVEVEE